MPWFSRNHHSNFASSSNYPTDDLPPEWAPAGASEPSRKWGLFNEASTDDYKAGEDFCYRHPMRPPRIIPSATVELIDSIGCKAWDLVPPAVSPRRFRGSIQALSWGSPIDNSTIATTSEKAKRAPKVIKVTTEKKCGDCCIMSNLPIMAGQYELGNGKEGVYFEVTILKMDGVIAIGTACQPYPPFRFPGWNRGSAGLHLDDCQKFYEDPNGGRPYSSRLTRIRPGDVVGCGYEFETGILFYTYNGERLDMAFQFIYHELKDFDVYAAFGVSGPGANEFVVNFGGDDEDYLFKWKPGREWGWLPQGHVGGKLRTSGGAGMGDELPTYEQARRS